jgi:nitrogen fixation protein NifU and related proteins
MSLQELYQEVIIDHGRNPRNKGILENANHHQIGYNPLCGDQLTIYILEKDQCVSEVRFEGSGCAISMASASLMTEAIKGKTISAVIELFERFHSMLIDGKETDLGKLNVLSGVQAYPMRVKCATLAWHTLKAALLNDQQPVSTE